MCEEELGTAEEVMQRSWTEVEGVIGVKVVKMARVEEVTRGVREQGERVKELRGDLEAVNRGEEDAESD